MTAISDHQASTRRTVECDECDGTGARVVSTIVDGEPEMDLDVCGCVLSLLEREPNGCDVLVDLVPEPGAVPPF